LARATVRDPAFFSKWHRSAAVSTRPPGGPAGAANPALLWRSRPAERHAGRGGRSHGARFTIPRSDEAARGRLGDIAWNPFQAYADPGSFNRRISNAPDRRTVSSARWAEFPAPFPRRGSE